MNITLDNTRCFVGTGGAHWQADQRTLVLIHGAGMDRTVWVLLARYYARHGYNVVVPDLPGHGASDGDALTSIEDQAGFIWSLLDTLHADYKLPPGKVTMAGHSMGALCASEATLQRPDSVEQVLLFGAGFPMGVGEALLSAAKANEQSAVDMIAIYAHSLGSQLGHNAVAGISVMNTAMALLERARPGVLYTDLNACNNYQGLSDHSGELALPPCTLLAGKEDKMTPLKAAQNMAKLLSAKVVVLDNCGHMMMSEQPEATLRATREVLL